MVMTIHNTVCILATPLTLHRCMLNGWVSTGAAYLFRETESECACMHLRVSVSE